MRRSDANVTYCIGDNTVVEFVEGTLTAGRAASVERHMAVCEPCRLRVVALGASSSRLANAPTPPAGIGAHLHLRPGARIDRFIVLNRLGHGGMGVVFAAIDPDLRRRVAVKLLRSGSGADSQFLQSSDDLRDEARIMASLHHPNIVAVHETGTFRDEAYLVMELVEGTTLGAWLSRWGQRPWTAVVDSFVQAGRALAHAHAHGLAHGDFKPENVLVDDSDRVRVTDFGLARPFSAHPHGQSRNDQLTEGERPAMVMGTPRYMAPEQYRGQPADALSDQFSFCVAMFEALYGQHPCTHDNPRSILELPADEIWTGIPRTSDVPAAIGRVLSRGLHPNPRARYRSMDELLAALQPITQMRRPRWLAFAGALVAAASVAGFVTGQQLSAGPRDALAPTAQPAESTSPVVRVQSPPVHSPPLPSSTIDGSQAALAASGHDRGKDAYRHYLTARTDSQSLSLIKQIHTFLNDELDAAREAITAAQRRVRSAQAAPDAAHTREETPSVTDGRPLDRRAEPAPVWEHRVSQQLSQIAEHVDELERIQTAQDARITRLERRRAARPKPRKRSLNQKNGLSTSAVQARIESRFADLHVCFKEWSERHVTGRGKLTVLLHINRRGRVRIDGHRGLTDRIVRKCTAGALSDIRFARKRRASAVAVSFVQSQRSLRITTRKRRRASSRR